MEEDQAFQYIGIRITNKHMLESNKLSTTFKQLGLPSGYFLPNLDQ